MKTIKLLTVKQMLAAALALAVFVPYVGKAAEPSFREPSIMFVVDPVYPMLLSAVGIAEGSATIMVSLDNEGKMVDWLALSATRSEFVRSVKNVIDRWTFTPAVRDGVPVPSALCISLKFRSEGVVMNMNGIQMVQSLMNGFVDPVEQSLIAKYSDLDRLPEPVTVVHPMLDADVPAGQRVGEVVLAFFIDSEGKVRMPVLMEHTGDIRMAYAAYDALMQWQFTSPTADGKPVTVRASQKFIFRDVVKDAAKAEPAK